MIIKVLDKMFKAAVYVGLFTSQRGVEFALGG